MKTTRDTRRERDGRRSLHVLGPMLAAATLMGIPALPRAQNVARGDVTFTKDIAPVVQRSCENCHRKGGVAPMSLSTYVEARPWARAMKRATSAGEMPPWFIDRNIGIQKFKDDISLSEEEIGKIARWADSGAPQGNPADMPPPRHYPDPRGWTIGPPDLIVSSPVMIVKPSAPDWHGEVGPVLTGLTEDRYVQAVETKEVRLNDNGLPDEEGFKRVRGAIGDLNFFLPRIHNRPAGADAARCTGSESGGMCTAVPARSRSTLSRSFETTPRTTPRRPSRRTAFS